MKKFVPLVLVLVIAFKSYGQRTDTLVKKLDSLAAKADTTNQINNTNPKAYNESTQFTPSSFFILQASNLKQSFLKPLHMSGHDWGLVGKFALVTGALALTDESVQRYALDLRNHNKELRSISAQVTSFGGLYEGYTLGALGAYGFLFHNKKMQTTTLLAVQSYITGAAVESVLKFLSGRQRPYVINSNEDVPEPRFWGPFKTFKDENGSKTNSSFPSGHTTVAFAAATVFAQEYSHKPWVPILCYSSATLIGLSRITENRHWATDVLTGGVLGYLVGRQVVNNYHRYAKIKAPKRKNAVSFSLDYNYGQLMPAFIYRF